MSAQTDQLPVATGFFDLPVERAAEMLLGMRLLVNGVGGIVVETEAYGVGDAASHTFNGETPRNRAMFGPPGIAYVYRSYGLHWCFNIVCRRAEAVLIRALEPTHSVEIMRERRGVSDVRLLCSGPGRLCQALRLTGDMTGLQIDRAPFALHVGAIVESARGTRIGITKDVARPWRFGIRDSRFLSKPLRDGA